ncbi:hypothetical protein [Aquimarina sp. Aq78]|uniref:hypothetical protein n=1 Tax=Aquimarina sp. Aq78 TaxID=1191889 RepID=UPI000D0F535F|nr:hypothetical protein [Aquimarina sp. Aq78]
MKKLVKIGLALVVSFSLFSCSTENDTLVEDSKSNDLGLERIKIFDDSEDFKNTLRLFSTFNEVSDYEKWSYGHNYVSVYNSDKISIEDKNSTPYAFLFILNENKEFKIGNKLINYSDGIFYENTIDDSGNLIKEDKVIGTFEQELSPLEETELEGTASKVTLSVQNGTLYKPTNGWKEFDRNTYQSYCGTPKNKSLKYRLVHYLAVETLNLFGVTQSDVYFKLRMSHKGGSNWVYNNTTTERLYNVNVSGNCKMKFHTGSQSGNTQYFSLSSYNNCSNPLKGTKYFPLATHVFFNPTNTSLYKWEVSLSGTVFHKVNGDNQQFNANVNW